MVIVRRSALALLCLSSATAFLGSWQPLSSFRAPLHSKKATRGTVLQAAPGNDGDGDVNDRLRSAYNEWCSTHNYQFDESRLDIFSYHYLLAEKHSHDHGSALTLNEYADLTTQEFRKLQEIGGSIQDVRSAQITEKDRQESGMPPEIWTNTAKTSKMTTSSSEKHDDKPDQVESQASEPPETTITSTRSPEVPTNQVPVQSMSAATVKANSSPAASTSNFPQQQQASFRMNSGKMAKPLGGMGAMSRQSRASGVSGYSPASRGLATDQPRSDLSSGSARGLGGYSSPSSSVGRGQVNTRGNAVDGGVYSASNNYNTGIPMRASSAVAKSQPQHNSMNIKGSQSTHSNNQSMAFKGAQNPSNKGLSMSSPGRPTRPVKPDTTYEYFAKEKASNLGLDIKTIMGSGPNGRVTVADVDAAAAPVILLRQEQEQSKAALDQTTVSLEQAKKEIEHLSSVKESSSERISQLEKLLEESQRDLQSKEKSFASRMAEIVTEKTGIESQKVAAEKKLELLQAQLSKLSTEKQGIEASKGEFEKQLAETEQKMRTLQDSRDSSITQIAEIERILADVGMKSSAELTNKMDGLAASHGAADARLKDIGESIVRLQGQRDSALSKISDLEQLLADATKKMQVERESYLSQIADLKKQKAEVEERLRESQDWVKKLSNEKDSATRNLQEAEASVEAVEAKLKDAGNQIESLRNEKNEIEAQRSGVQTAKAETERRLAETEGRATMLAAENAKIKSQFDSEATAMQEEIRTLQGRLENIETAKQDVETKLQNAQRSVSALESQASSSYQTIADLKREASDAQGRLRDVQFESQSTKGALQLEIGALELKLKNITTAKTGVDAQLHEAQQVISRLEAGEQSSLGVISNIRREKSEVEGHLKDAKYEIQSVKTHLQQEIAAMSRKTESIENEKEEIENLVKDLVYPYKDNRYWFETYDPIRKLIQTSGVALVLVYGQEFAVSVAVNLSIIFLCVLIIMSPYKEKSDLLLRR